MTHSISEGDKPTEILMILAKRVTLLYVVFSLCRYFMFDDAILSKNRTVIIMSLVIAISSIIYSWLRPFLQMYWKRKKYQYFFRSVESILMIYLSISFIRYAIIQDSLLSKNEGIITFAIMMGSIGAVEAKIDDVSPRNPKNEPDKPLKYYIDTYIIHATPFHKVMFFVYALCIFLPLLLFILIK